MRLICPNCDAQYEVADKVIPDEGRDVQCSSCGHAWFQVSARAQALQEEEDASRASAPARAAAPDHPVSVQHEPFPPDPRVDDVPGGARTPAPEDADGELVAVAEGGADAPEPPTAAPEPPASPRTTPPVRSLNETVLAVLREEAEREVQARAREDHRLESQGDLGLDTIGAAVSRMRPPAPPEPAEPHYAPDEPEAPPITRPEPLMRPARGRELLPDIEEINSTLSPAEDSGVESVLAQEEERRRGASGFRLGFGLMLLAAIGLVGLYVFAPALSLRLPALQGALSGYVALIDALRLWLSHQLQSATAALQG